MSDQIKLCLVVAMAQNRVIGRDNQLPWRLPKDLAYFKQVTMNHPIVMGRKTFDSIGRPLPGRENIVVTRQQNWSAEGAVVARSLEQALALARDLAKNKGLNKVMLIGGSELYTQSLELADRLYLTEVLANVEGDAYFPEFSREQWDEIERSEHSADQSNPYDYAFVVLNRHADKK